MYDYIRGRLIEKTPTYVVIEANGIGFSLSISLHTYTRIKDEEACALFTHFVVREDAHILFGFAEVQERELFRQLISVSGVGPNTARMILSSATPSEIVTAISSGDVGFLKSVKGIGVKTAERIIVDLKGKVSKDLISSEKLEIVHNTRKEEALSGLVILGFPKSVAEKALNKITEKEGAEIPVEQLIRHALKIL